MPRYRDCFDDPNLPDGLTVTMTLNAVSTGTDLTIAQEGIPDPIPVEAFYLGWRQSLLHLAKIVEPDIQQ